jgi:hypothetical protein
MAVLLIIIGMLSALGGLFCLTRLDKGYTYIFAAALFAMFTVVFFALARLFDRVAALERRGQKQDRTSTEEAPNQGIEANQPVTLIASSRALRAEV